MPFVMICSCSVPQKFLWWRFGHYSRRRWRWSFLKWLDDRGSNLINKLTCIDLLMNAYWNGFRGRSFVAEGSFRTLFPCYHEVSSSIYGVFPSMLMFLFATSKTMSQMESFFLQNCFSDIFVTTMEYWLTYLFPLIICTFSCNRDIENIICIDVFKQFMTKLEQKLQYQETVAFIVTTWLIKGKFTKISLSKNLWKTNIGQYKPIYF